MSRSLPALAALLAVVPLAAQEAPRVRELSEVETRPAVRNAPELQAALAAGYPAELAGAGVAGTVVVEFVVGADGAVREPRVVEAPHEALGAATVEAVRVLRFDPATVGGAPVDVRVTFPVQWSAAPPAGSATKTPSGPRESREEALRRLIGDDPVLAAMAASAYELSEVEEMPRLTNAQDLIQALRHEYPAELRSAGREGTVLVRFVIDTDGKPHLGDTSDSTDPAFEEPTLRVIQVLRFRPAKVGGRPVAVWVDLPIQWTAH